MHACTQKKPLLDSSHHQTKQRRPNVETIVLFFAISWDRSTKLHFHTRFYGFDRFRWFGGKCNISFPGVETLLMWLICNNNWVHENGSISGKSTRVSANLAEKRMNSQNVIHYPIIHQSHNRFKCRSGAVADAINKEEGLNNECHREFRNVQSVRDVFELTPSYLSAAPTGCVRSVHHHCVANIYASKSSVI